MRVFVAGASGVIGRPLVRALVAAGHEVTAMTRRVERAEAIMAAGAKALVCDVFDLDRLRDAVGEADPEVVVHQLTALPAALDYRDATLYEATDRVRREGTRNLIDAALAGGARRMVAQSIAAFYLPTGGWIKNEEAPVMAEAPAPFGAAIRAIDDLERQVLDADALEGLVLRYGFFYGPGTHFDRSGYYAGEVGRRRFPVVGSGRGHFSFIHVDDAAAATVAACEQGSPGIYNVVDDEPAAMREWLPAYAEALGAKRPFRVPALVAALVAGRAVTVMATQMRGASNEKARRELQWVPQHPTWRRGFVETLRERPADTPR